MQNSNRTKVQRLVREPPEVGLWLLLMILASNVVISPLVIDNKNMASTLFACLMIAGLILVLGSLTKGRSKARLLLLLTGATLVCLRIIAGVNVSLQWLTWVTLAAILSFNFVMMVVLIKHLFLQVPQVEKLLAAINFYLLTGISFSYLYLLVNLVDPAAFNLAGQTITNWPDYLYFSFVTFTTLGYGDILPQSPLAQSLVSMEAVIGVLSPTVMIARFVGH